MQALPACHADMRDEVKPLSRFETLGLCETSYISGLLSSGSGAGEAMPCLKHGANKAVQNETKHTIIILNLQF